MQTNRKNGCQAQRKHRKLLLGKQGAMFLLCGLLLAGGTAAHAVVAPAVLAQGLAGEETAESANSVERRELQITVVEDIPAAEIEDSAVPLAGVPGAEKRSADRNRVRMAVLTAAAVLILLGVVFGSRRIRYRTQENRLREAVRTLRDSEQRKNGIESAKAAKGYPGEGDV